MFRHYVRLVPAVLVGLLLSGCGPSKGDMEKSIRDEMKTQLGVAVKSVDLTKQDDGTFVGTATAENGDLYDVTSSVGKNYEVEWKAVPGQAVVEKGFHDTLEKELSAKLKTFQLTKHGPGNYSGTAEFVTGDVMKITAYMDGTKLIYKWEPMPDSAKDRSNKGK